MAAPASQPEKPADPKSEPAKSGKKPIMMIGALLLVEAIMIIGAMMMLAKPATVQAGHDEAEEPGDAEADKVVEVMVLDDRMVNDRTGVNYLYEVEIWVHVRKKNEARVTDELTRFKNEIKAELMAIWRTAEPRHLAEPRLENLTRKTEELLNIRFGSETESSEHVIQKCVIVSGPGFRVEA